MKFVPTLLFPLSYSVLALQGVLQRSDPQFIHLTFHGGLASYSIAFPVDGSTRKTNHDLSVDVIHNSDYNALEQCFFAIEDQAKLTSKVSTKDGSQHILDNSPRVIIAVDCTGSCVPMYGECYDTRGQPVGPCCNGMCMANRCRPWNSTLS
ncbi:hypothetical protein FOXG_15619 [Fusarium oxysporum f. sp. lycopersici 4287]|uniref:Uncharacterized protein n=1 Tax=Fusarium oxysporum f. sp. lycopersici (strain 4287 / CBS 123668 / FGSC 9935 / NRRL 34936) TaxID=426428 RepID=A0A0J9W567_FUSO4|nr:hypothetical protein FOXG_15619 [Fusarium oxysporum f. sp. lycopersici 4287]KAJ9420203.1 hypothetical protein QL093DRAFT_2013829 [Fusarium oxysporum]KNB17921.1 hypothetical protein FOXG_15619 [Fusarium oxysporum f. sp. lycopersici 4287]